LNGPKYAPFPSLTTGPKLPTSAQAHPENRPEPSSREHCVKVVLAEILYPDCAGTSKGFVIELLLLYALAFDGSMWTNQMDLRPVSMSVLTLYGSGKTMEDWALGGLATTESNNLIIVDCSILSTDPMEGGKKLARSGIAESRQKKTPAK
jgi:hypothetical protein